MNLRPIVTEADRLEAIREIDRLWGADIGTPDGDMLEALAILVEAYDHKHYPLAPVDPVETIIGHMDLNGLTQSDLATLLGSRSRASEILGRKRPLTLEMIHKLHSEWGIPAEFLIQPYKLDAA